jgi:hypothetical protein
MPETRSVTTNAINPTGLFRDTIPSTTPNREKHSCKIRPLSPICPLRGSFDGSDRRSRSSLRWRNFDPVINEALARDVVCGNAIMQ